MLQGDGADMAPVVAAVAAILAPTAVDNAKMFLVTTSTRKHGTRYDCKLRQNAPEWMLYFWIGFARPLRP